MRQVLLIVDVQSTFSPPEWLVDGLRRLSANIPTVASVELHDERVTPFARQLGWHPAAEDESLVEADQVFVKQVQALGRPEDLALGISTSGTSANVVKGMQAAREIGMRTAALTGGTVRPGGDLAALCDLVLNVPADATPHIQETHLWIEHVLCEIVEKQMFGSA